ncbi:helix-turn-helix domain-containing protein [Faecalicatena sp. AGMB00832]|uniref:Helix-turn-helix domain-containing protein n=1 Tax=Faecalicatena faecalis TaxID=2726362 RepID=A0ABS6D9Z0_9FIRM|nr:MULTISPECIES: helix-turn-helix transcriptional regulator [Faecalicatena]MBU3878035.1 helix-turn-helix domain-containing protein [Faecalicatena faecalis]MCI6467689.1 helix-turn-helix domain-containing protein [Faecalicatena sp.]MDY5616940.1 helix-turn-helix transcriptional regulator [Lachnospiraceae bacterium]
MTENRLGNRLKRFRTACNMTQFDLAKPLNMSRQTVSTYETGSRVPDIYTLWAMADLYEISIDELIGRDTGQK